MDQDVETTNLVQYQYRAEGDARSLTEVAMRFNIQTAADADEAAKFRNHVRDRKARTKELFAATCDSTYKAWKAATELRDMALACYEPVLDLMKTKLLAYEDQRIKAEKEAAEKAEQERIAAQIELEIQADSLGHNGPVEEVLAPPPVVAPKVTGLSFLSMPSVVVTDLAALVQSVAKGETPVAYVMANLTTMNGAARVQGPLFNVPPGCELRINRTLRKTR